MIAGNSKTGFHAANAERKGQGRKSHSPITITFAKNAQRKTNGNEQTKPRGKLQGLSCCDLSGHGPGKPRFFGKRRRMRLEPAFHRRKPAYPQKYFRSIDENG